MSGFTRNPFWCVNHAGEAQVEESQTHTQTPAVDGVSGPTRGDTYSSPYPFCCANRAGGAQVEEDRSCLASDGTLKLVLSLSDGSEVESVLIPPLPEGQGRRAASARAKSTLCVSSQVPIRVSFYLSIHISIYPCMYMSVHN